MKVDPCGIRVLFAKEQTLSDTWNTNVDRSHGMADRHGGPEAAWIRALARPDVLALQPYRPVRDGAVADSDGSWLRLDANESFRSPLSEAWTALQPHRYPEPQPRRLVAAFAAEYGVAEDMVVLTRGSSEGIDLLVRAFCRAGTDRVVVLPPTFELYATAAAIQGARVEEVPLIQDEDWQPHVAAIVDRCRQKSSVKVVFVCSPNNPTGGRIERRRLLELCERLRGRALVVVDEAYIAFSDEPSLTGDLADHANLVVLRTLSKEHGLAGERFGMVVAHPATVEVLQRIRPPYPLAGSAVAAVSEALEPAGRRRAAATVRIVRQERARMAAVLRAHPDVLEVHRSDANFLLLRVADPRGLVAEAVKHGILVRDRSALPGLEGCVRVTVGSRSENDIALDVLTRGLTATTRPTQGRPSVDAGTVRARRAASASNGAA